MTILVSPNDNLTGGPIDYVFLAGGISNCPDWQGPIADRINGALPDLIIVNPRRNGWDMSRDREESIAQIRWEHKYLAKSVDQIFWFPKETLCPITLLELGKAIAPSLRGKPTLWVGTHPEYQRRLDVEIQCSLEGHDYIWNDLDAMVADYIDSRLNFQ